MGFGILSILFIKLRFALCKIYFLYFILIYILYLFEGNLNSIKIVQISKFCILLIGLHNENIGDLIWKCTNFIFFIGISNDKDNLWNFSEFFIVIIRFLLNSFANVKTIKIAILYF